MNRVDQKGTVKNFAFFLHLTHVWEMNNKTQPDNWPAEKEKHIRWFWLSFIRQLKLIKV